MTSTGTSADAAPRLAGPDDAGEVGRVLAAGFLDDPVMCWVFGERSRAEKLEAFFGFLAAEALVPLGASWMLPGSCANWTPPGAPEWPEERSTRMLELLERTTSSDEQERLGILDREMQAHHPDGDLWYLGTIATEPALRGRGSGTRLLQASLPRVDADRLPAYLESTNPRNVSLYERHGFRTTGTIDLPDGPSLITMWRDPR